MTRRHQPHTVSLAQFWENEWEEQTGLYCDSFTLAAGPDVSECVLTRWYGRVTPPGESQPETRTPLSIDGYYVKVELSQEQDDDEAEPIIWRGIVVETVDDKTGAAGAGSGSTIRTGRQRFICRGLEFLLHRSIVDSSFVQPNEGDEIEIGRAIAFNLGQGRDTDHVRKGNMQIGGSLETSIFSFDLGIEWTAYDIARYLLAYHPPKNIDGDDVIGWEAPDSDDNWAILKTLKPTLHVHGKSVKQVLDEVIDRRRLVGWKIEYSEGESPQLHAFTFNKETLTLSEGSDEPIVVPGNSNQTTWFFEDDQTLREAVLAADDATRFDVVIARGEPLAACFTVSADTSTLEADWEPTVATEYDDAASGDAGYSALDDWEKTNANQEFRRDDKFKKVYSYFRVPSDWDGMIGAEPACPDPTKADEEGTSLDPSPFWWPGLRMLDKLPLLTDHDYETVEDFDTTDKTIDNSFPEYLRPFAVIKAEDTPDRYYYMDSMSQGRDLTTSSLETNGRNWAASLRMQDHVPGLIINVAGMPQHVIASTEFTAADSVDSADYKAELSWQDIYATVCCEFDQYVEARWPEGELSTDADVVRELIIDMPNCRLDYLAPDTIIGINPDGTSKTTDGGYVRDDRQLLKDIARSAFEWYGQTRKALTVTQHDLITDKRIGQLITNVGTASQAVEVNSVVTKMAFDLRQGTVTIQTQFAELDPRVGVRA